MFYKGEQVGERRYFDERLTMFILRLRDPVGYGKWRERVPFERDDDARATRAAGLVECTERDAERHARRDRPFAYLDRLSDDDLPDDDEPKDDSPATRDTDGDVS